MSMFSTPQQQTQSPFQPQQPQTNLFQQTNPFQQLQQQQQPQPQPQFQQQQFQFQQPQQQQQQQQQLFLFTNDKTPATYGTKWADLHPDSQKFLLQIEERILEYRDESQRLDQCSRLYDSSVYNGSFELDASHIVQELGGISTATERQKAQLQELMTSVKGLLWNTEVAVRSFMILRPRFLRPNVGASSSATAPSQGAGSVLAPGTNPASSIMPVYDFYNGLPRKPSPFLQQTVSRFEKYLGECRQWVEELEQLILTDFDRNSSSRTLSLLESLPNVMSNVHGFFVHVAAKVESIHQYIESMKTAYLAEQRHRRDGNDPFLEADHRETAKQEAAARRVHPTLHLPATLQPQAQVAGLIASSAASGSLTALQSSAAVSAASSGGGFSLFTTRSAAPTAATSSSSLFSTPATSAPASLFAPSAASPQSSTFPLSGSASSMFSNTAASFVPTTPAGPLFSTPFSSGATPGPATGSGASFGPTSKSARGKSRATRR